MANQRQRTAYLQAQRGELQRWLPELEQLVMLRASRDKEWSLFTNSLQYNQQRELEKQRQGPQIRRLDLAEEQFEFDKSEAKSLRDKQEADKERARQTFGILAKQRGLDTAGVDIESPGMWNLFTANQVYMEEEVDEKRQKGADERAWKAFAERRPDEAAMLDPEEIHANELFALEMKLQEMERSKAAEATTEGREAETYEFTREQRAEAKKELARAKMDRNKAEILSPTLKATRDAKIFENYVKIRKELIPKHRESFRLWYKDTFGQEPSDLGTIMGGGIGPVDVKERSRRAGVAVARDMGLDPSNMPEDKATLDEYRRRVQELLQATGGVE